MRKFTRSERDIHAHLWLLIKGIVSVHKKTDDMDTCIYRDKKQTKKPKKPTKKNKTNKTKQKHYSATDYKVPKLPFFVY